MILVYYATRLKMQSNRKRSVSVLTLHAVIYFIIIDAILSSMNSWLYSTNHFAWFKVEPGTEQTAKWDFTAKQSDTTNRAAPAMLDVAHQVIRVPLPSVVPYFWAMLQPTPWPGQCERVGKGRHSLLIFTKLAPQLPIFNRQTWLANKIFGLHFCSIVWNRKRISQPHIYARDRLPNNADFITKVRYGPLPSSAALQLEKTNVH